MYVQQIDLFLALCGDSTEQRWQGQTHQTPGFGCQPHCPLHSQNFPTAYMRGHTTRPPSSDPRGEPHLLLLIQIRAVMLKLFFFYFKRTALTTDRRNALDLKDRQFPGPEMITYCYTSTKELY